jgi:hypothetical protein
MSWGTMKNVAVRCHISRSPFSDQRIFRIQPLDGSECIGDALAKYFWTEDLKPITTDQPEQRGVLLPGYVAAYEMRRENGAVVVYLPSGDVIDVAADSVVKRPVERTDDVPVQP